MHNVQLVKPPVRVHAGFMIIKRAVLIIAQHLQATCAPMVRLAWLVKLLDGPFENGIGSSAFIDCDENISRATVCSRHCFSNKTCVGVPQFRKVRVGVFEACQNLFVQKPNTMNYIGTLLTMYNLHASVVSSDLLRGAT